MAHELSFRVDGTAELVYAHLDKGSLPWHGYGQPIPLGLTWEEAIILAKLDWPVGKVPVQYEADGDGTLRTFPERFVTFRQDTRAGLGIVGSDYMVINNERAFRAAVQVARIRGGVVETMGALRGGKVVWCLIRLPETFNVNGDTHLKYLLVYTSHDGTTKVRVKVTAVRVVCKNTADCALYGMGRELSFAHTHNFDAEVKAAEGILEATDDVYEAYRKAAEGLVETPVPVIAADAAIETFAKRAMWQGATREELEKALVGDMIMDSVVRATERKYKRLRNAVDLIHTRLDEEVAGHREITAWLLENAMTGWAQHERSGSVGERRFSSLLLGEGARLCAIAHDVVMETVARAA